MDGIAPAFVATASAPATVRTMGITINYRVEAEAVAEASLGGYADHQSAY